MTTNYSSITHITLVFEETKKYPDAHTQLNAIYSKKLHGLRYISLHQKQEPKYLIKPWTT